MNSIDTRRHIDVFSPDLFGKRRIDVIGAGATGSRVVLALAKLGLDNIHVWDFDHVEAHNIANQVFGLADIGKLKIDPEILNKPGKLTAEEYEIIKTHPDLGAELARPLAGWLGPSVRAVSEHHEKWDGSGYPQGLAAEAIPESARIVAIADVFDALTTARPYKKAWTIEAAVSHIEAHAGSHFDPELIEPFRQALPEMLPGI